MQHNQIHQQRAAVYRWFSQLLFRELDEKQLASLENGNSQAWIASLEAIPGLSANVKRFERSWAGFCGVTPDSWSWPQILPRCFCWPRRLVFLPMRGTIHTRQRQKNVGK